MCGEVFPARGIGTHMRHKHPNELTPELSVEETESLKEFMDVVPGLKTLLDQEKTPADKEKFIKGLEVHWEKISKKNTGEYKKALLGVAYLLRRYAKIAPY